MGPLPYDVDGNNKQVWGWIEHWLDCQAFKPSMWSNFISLFRAQPYHMENDEAQF